jgi:hypothetical protein
LLGRRSPVSGFRRGRTQDEIEHQTNDEYDYDSAANEQRFVVSESSTESSLLPGGAAHGILSSFSDLFPTLLIAWNALIIGLVTIEHVCRHNAALFSLT